MYNATKYISSLFDWLNYFRIYKHNMFESRTIQVEAQLFTWSWPWRNPLYHMFFVKVGQLCPELDQHLLCGQCEVSKSPCWQTTLSRRCSKLMSLQDHQQRPVKDHERTPVSQTDGWDPERWGAILWGWTFLLKGNQNINTLSSNKPYACPVCIMSGT